MLQVWEPVLYMLQLLQLMQLITPGGPVYLNQGETQLLTASQPEADILIAG